MKNRVLFVFVSVMLLLTVVGTALVGTASSQSGENTKSRKTENANAKEKKMKLGNFSVSLAVKDIKASRDFYQKFDFQIVGGNIDQKWLILQNGTTTIGLFQGMFDRNVMTFNPGWDKDMKTLKDFDDVRDLQSTLKERGLKLTTEADKSADGPASFTLVDPDGNPIMVDQHVARPGNK